MPRKAPKQPTADDILKQMYPDIMTSEDYADVKEDPAAKPTQNQHVSPEVAQLQAELAALREQMSVQTRTNSALMTRQAKPVPPQPPAPMDKKKLAALLVDDPEAYAEALQKTIDARVQYEKDLMAFQQNQQVSASRQNDLLWNDFSSKYPEYAKQDRKVAIAAREVLDRAIANNQDPDAYMYGNSAGFMQDVVKEMDTLWGKAKPADDDDVDDDPDDDGDDGRTDGFFGAGLQEGPAAKAAKKPPEPFGDLSKELLAWQGKTGFHR